MSYLARLAINAVVAGIFAVALGEAVHHRDLTMIIFTIAGILVGVMAMVETTQHQRTTEVHRRTLARERARADYAEAEIKKLRRAQHEKNMW